MATERPLQDLSIAGVPVLAQVDAALSVNSEPSGLLLSVGPVETPRLKIAIGRPIGAKRFLACYRYDPYWMRPCVGTHTSALPVDTQMALFEREDKQYLLIVPLLSSPYRSSLHGENSQLHVTLDSGSPRARADGALIALVALGKDPHALMRQSARRLQAAQGVGKLRIEKASPDFVDLFGWCTWDAFYRDVSHDKVRAGLESFKAGGVEPRLMILDDGWQTVTDQTNNGRLAGFEPNDKFGPNLAQTVHLAKHTFRVERFLCWHTIHGYWSGISPETFPQYSPRRVLRWYSPEVLNHAPAMNTDFLDSYADCPAPSKLEAFYDDYHGALAKHGVDGVKVDNQASVEGLSHDVSGRVVNMAITRRALEKSVKRHFSGRLLNCMSCSNDMLYMAEDSTLTRTSTDFWPRLPDTYGQHLYTNAMVSLWFGEFVLPDWDMFQSGHPAGEYHAHARAMSGGPVYVSDKPGAHNFELLRRLVMPDGRLPRARSIARPTLDSLFHSLEGEPTLLKLFNRNLGNYVLGVFNTRYHAKGPNNIAGNVGVEDIPTVSDDLWEDDAERILAQHWSRAERFCLTSPTGELFRIVSRAERHPISLPELGSRVFTLAPFVGDFAVVGVQEYLNVGGTILDIDHTDEALTVEVACPGTLLLGALKAPRTIHSATDPSGALPFSYAAAESRLEVSIPRGASRIIVRL